MFAVALIVFRETLEAALFVGIVAAAAIGLAGRQRWLLWGVAAGAAGALILAMLAQHISAWADGLGQDLINIFVLVTALAMLLWHCVWVASNSTKTAADAKRLGATIASGGRTPWALLSAVALAVLREGAETVLFVAGSLTGQDTSASAVVAWAATGLLCGASVGYVLYLGLSFIPARRLFFVTNVLIALLAGSIASQLAKVLAQAGLLEYGIQALWDSSSLVSRDSPLGTLLHALVGYEATPSGAQLAAFISTLAAVVFGTMVIRRFRAR